MSLTITLYFREGCHLCDDMRRLLYPFVAKHNLSLVETDIDREQKLFDLYDVKVPVLCHRDNELFYHFYDAGKIESWLNSVQ